MNEVAPPRTKGEVHKSFTDTRVDRTGSTNLSLFEKEYKNVKAHKEENKEEEKVRKAKRSEQKVLDRAQKKVKKKQALLSSAKLSLKRKKEAIIEVKKAVIGKDVNFLTEELLQDAPPSVRELVKSRGTVFGPNSPPQAAFLAASEREVFYGGARGGGKSYALVLNPLRYCHKARHRALILRRTMPELRELIEESLRIYPKAFPGAKFRVQEKEWRFPSGARIEFGYAESRQDALRYQGQSYTEIDVDELPQWADPRIWNDLRACLRSVDPEIPTYMRATGNPGNIGSQWVREMFIDPAPANTKFVIVLDTPFGKKEITRKFIPARVTDNPALMQTDDYLIMLSSLPEIQRKQWLEGDWDVFENAAFPEFDESIHVIEPFSIPSTWTRFRACDWGYSSPACVLWFAVDYDGNLIVYRELYVTKMTADVFALKVKFLEQDDPKPIRGIMDASTWAKRGDVGPGIPEVMRKNGVAWRPSDRSPNSRKNGKMEVHRRLALDFETEEPRIKFFKTCKNIIRQLKRIPTDENNCEDVDTKAEDHAYDALRYGVMSRPMSPTDLMDISNFIKKQDYQPVDSVFGY